MTSRGKFISLEGGEGVGKSTQVKALAAALRSRGLDVIETREPGGSEGAEKIRELLLSGAEERWGSQAEALLFAAARADHGDHVHGIDELRPLSQVLDAPVPVYGSEETLASLEQRFAYAFAQSDFYRPIIEGRVIAAEERFGPTTARFVVQPHGTTTSLGLRFDEAGHSIVYAIDFSDLTDEMAQLYKGVDVWIADCLTRTPHPTHAHLDGVLGWARDLNVGQLYLTHMRSLSRVAAARNRS